MNSRKGILVITSLAALLFGAIAVVQVYKRTVNPGLRRRLHESLTS
jgi:hypothetical protein